MRIQLEWKRGNYDTAQLNTLYTCNAARAAKVIRELREKVTSTEQMRAIGFCGSVQSNPTRGGRTLAAQMGPKIHDKRL